MKITDSIYADAERIVEVTQKQAFYAVDRMLILRNWLLGRRIFEEELKGKGRAEYGAEVIIRLSKYLNEKYGRGFSKRYLWEYLRFYKAYPEIVQIPSAQFESTKETEIVQIASAQFKSLTWSHYRLLLQVSDKTAREWYEQETEKEMWSVKTLQRNISTQYYYRMLKSYDEEPVREEMKELNSPYEDKLEYIKSPYIAEFLGMQENRAYHESELEQRIIDNLQDFMMELGKGFTFAGRQKRIHTEKEDYYIDLVFYNYILKCFVLIDLKMGKITHQDVGQMDMYIRMYDKLVKMPEDNPTLGIVLCTETDEDIARYSILNGNEQLFASKYKLYLPTEEQLRAEIENQKQVFLAQQVEDENEIE
jgi:predicted nuclease of restriction endonuclease-like (RecB) superfamily